MLVRATVALAILRVAVGRVPFSTIARALSLREGQSAEVTDPATESRAALVGHAVSSAAAHMPWHSTCLMQALAAASLLRRCGIGATLYLGISREPAAPEGMLAHAWLRCGSRVLVGEAERKRFTVLASFAVVNSDRLGSAL